MRRSYPTWRSWAHVLLALVAIFSVLGPARSVFAQTPTPSAAPASSASARAPEAPAPSASAEGEAKPAEASAEVRVRDKVVYVIRARRGDRSAADRARVANGAIEALLAHPEDIGPTHVEETNGTAVVFVNKTPILTLAAEDVAAAGEASVQVLAAQVATRVGDAIASEHKRSVIAKTVFSFSLLVFSALIAFLLLGRASELAAKIRSSLLDNPERVTAVRLGKVEFVSAGSARGALTIAVTIGYRFLQLAIAYGWLIFALSLFEATHGYTERLTGLVVKPLYGLAERIGTALPLVVVAIIAVFAVSVLVRFVGLFFDSVARGDTRMVWLPRDLARPTSLLLRIGIIVVALVVGSPLITGESDGVISRAGIVALFAIGLSGTPLVASVVVGIPIVFGRRLRRGELVEIGGRSGRVLDVTLLDVRLEDASLAEVSVPHLLGLFHPTRVHKHAPLTTFEIVVDGAAAQDQVERALEEAARSLSARGSVELLYLDGAGARWRITSAASRSDVSLARAVQEALARIGVGLGRAPSPVKGHEGEPRT